MKLYKLLENIEHQFIKGGDTEIKGICFDSRKAEEGFLFVCIKGFETDGHKYVPEAVKKGIDAVVCEEEVSAPDSVAVIKVQNTRIALAGISSAFYGNPSERLKIIGVTGTNGKTTVTHLIDSILRESGEKTGIIGTIENRIGDMKLPADRTTPESLELFALLSKMLKEGVSTVSMEVSSHSLDLHRVEFCKFDVGVFTNLTREHLDYHKSMDNYLSAKARLFSKCRYGAVNGDDSASAEIIEKGTCEFMTFGLGDGNNLCAADISMSAEGVTFTTNIYGEQAEIKLPIPGKFSIYNALSAIAAAVLLKIPRAAIKSGLEKCGGVPGRAQAIRTAKERSIIIDYAHTPDGLENILEMISEFAKKRIITVFGCGGNRDKSKRPVMGEIAGKMSDFVIITSDNPRNEDPLDIIYEIEAGVKKTVCEYIKIPDRREAINYAVELSEPGDVVLIAGKGHETYQVFSDRTIRFDDAEAAYEAAKLLEDK